MIVYLFGHTSISPSIGLRLKLTDCPFSEMLHTRWPHLDSGRRWCSWLWWLVERDTGKLSTCWSPQPCSAVETWDFTSLQKSSYTPT